MLVRNSISVLLDEALRLVRDVDSIVAHGEGRLSKPWLLVELALVGREVVMQLSHKLLVCAHG